MKIKDAASSDLTIIDKEFVDAESKVFIDLNIPLLLNCTVSKYSDKIVIETTNSISSQSISTRLKELKEYFGKDVFVTISTPPPSEIKDTTQTPLPLKRGILSGRISAEYLETPYIVGKSNRFVYDLTRRLINSDEGTILFLYGESGTGKSHLLHQLANDFLEKGKSVYLTRGNDFVETVKTSYLARDEEGSKKKSFLNSLKKNHLFVIDDFQYLYQERLLKFIPDPLFEIIIQQLELGNVLAFSSDTPPTYANPHFHDRIVNRLVSGLVAQLELPDLDMKRAYVRYFCERNEFMVTPEIEQYVFTIAKNLRTVKGILTYCHALHEQKDLRIDRLVEITGKIFGGVAAARRSTEHDMIENVYSLLKEYYGIPDEVIKKMDEQKQARKPKMLAKIDSIAYYLLYKKVKVADNDYLKKYLHIKYNTEGYCARKGEEFYKNIAQGLKDEIEKILSLNPETGKVEQGELWEK